MSTVDWAAEHQAIIDRHDSAVREVGLSEVWDHLLAQEDTAARGLLLGIVGPLGTCLREMGYTPPT